MAEIIAPNIPTNCASLTAITARNLEVPDYIDGETTDPFTDTPGDGTFDDPYLGLNRAGGSNSGIGICTGLLYQTAAELAAGEIFTGWTELDQGAPAGSGGSQSPVARIPQAGQLIGGVDASMDPDDNGSPIQPQPPALIGEIPVTMTEGAVIADTANLVIVDTPIADGGVMDSVSGAINNTGAPVAVGDLVWGKVVA